MKDEQFTWIPFYMELADKLFIFKNNRKELLKIVYSLNRKYVDYIHNDDKTDVTDIDPFSVFAIFNRGLTDENRKNILKYFKERLNIEATIPNDFQGIPILNAQSSTFFWRETSATQIPILWDLFESAIKNDNSSFKIHFDNLQNTKGLKWNITIGLFWIRPNDYMPLDNNSRDYLQEQGISVFSEKEIDASNYISLLNDIKTNISDKSFPELSYMAWIEAKPFSFDEFWDIIKSKVENEGFSLKKKGKRYAWISSEQIEATRNCHYEFCSDNKFQAGHKKNYVYVEVHLENKKTLEQLKNRLSQINGIHDFKWDYGGYRMNDEGFELRGDINEVTDNVITELIELDKLVGETIKNEKDMNYWLVGFNFGSSNSQFDRFVKDSIWEGRFNDDSKSDQKQLQLAQTIKAGDVLILKSTSVKGPNHTIPFLRVKAVAVVKKNIELSKADNATFCKCEVEYHGIKDYDFEIAELSSIRTTIYYGNNDSKVQPVIEYAISILNPNNINTMEYQKYIDLLRNNHNLILTGAPGTGKTYLAKQIAKAMGCTENEIGFVQFHPSYDYTDFVEGLRPKNENGSVGFERKDGVFKEFCEKAQGKFDIKNFDEVWTNFLNDLNETGKSLELKTPDGIVFSVSANKNNLVFDSPNYKGKYTLTRKDVRMEYSGIRNYNYWLDYYQCVIDYLESKYNLQKVGNKEQSPFVFIIDEINRGEISKIFGELFFSIDPGYRGEQGRVQTQYQNMVEDRDVFKKGFFVPENVYIIGTMNDIDRSVESMDFAFRRRFAFVEIKANENIGMLDDLEWKDEAIARMERLNNAISKIEGLTSAYHIGASYFLKLKNYNGDFSQLWDYHLEGLLFEYLRGVPGANEKLEQLKAAYNNESNSDNGQQ